MSGYGKEETAKLRSNVEDQLARLLQQLQDCEDLKDDLDEDEYESTKQDTLNQLREFEQSLQKMIAGDITLVNDLGGMRLAIQGAVSQAFRTPEVIKMFANKQPAQLRLRLEQKKEDLKLKRITQESYMAQVVEILTALKKLGEELNAEEEEFLKKNMSQQLAQFEAASSGDT
ncbi:hypothetical protein GUITHDRAFT_66454 [Guillardia theta CCMP2712]|uniref:Beta-catenin-interacting ICAT domain-containing protein n=1 Tax=Guillardia theta (strain CCMP2712) TaxID=905079 RepID=L1JQY9_GUITC|nr:hypothetical protein GUITHDRAFT_66454 [Guillardia theta CCMP2712]EKX50704.1 hypothetical protein GUITHDRAFT_66454 [Guillardia theta CCMP2712]|eukprot:XP_005837684.1 hypothetical protein GUITHDRAFT_66454 [Guillardia theta CCMP2712]